MPELPEVQTIVDDLNKKIVGDTITDFWTDWPKAIKGKKLAVFRREIKNRKILGARRIGKNIFIDLSGGKTLYIHLKMTGHLLVKSAKLKVKSLGKDYFSDKVNQYIHHIWYLTDSNQRMKCESTNKVSNSHGRIRSALFACKTMEFSDVRKFAKIVLDDTEKIKELPEIKKLGIDALDKKFTLKKFEEILSRRRSKAIGLTLMEQELIAGIGNIYRSEILFEAGILPTRAIKNLKEAEIKKIYEAIKKILEKAIKLRGTSDSDYRDTAGAPGKFQKTLNVYRKDGEKCRAYRQAGQKCDTIIIRIKMGQRSVFYCPGCQK